MDSLDSVKNMDTEQFINHISAMQNKIRLLGIAELPTFIDNGGNKYEFNPRVKSLTIKLYNPMQNIEIPLCWKYKTYVENMIVQNKGFGLRIVIPGENRYSYINYIGNDWTTEVELGKNNIAWIMSDNAIVRCKGGNKDKWRYFKPEPLIPLGKIAIGEKDILRATRDLSGVASTSLYIPYTSGSLFKHFCEYIASIWNVLSYKDTCRKRLYTDECVSIVLEDITEDEELQFRLNMKSSRSVRVHIQHELINDAVTKVLRQLRIDSTYNIECAGVNCVTENGRFT